MKISPQFEERLKTLEKSERLEVIVCAQGPEGKIGARLSDDERKKVIQQMTAATLPIAEYLREQKIGHKRGEPAALGQVYAVMTRDEVYALAREPYVKLIIENQGFQRLDRD